MSSGGELSVSSGATASGVVVQSGGLILEWAGAVVEGLTTAAGAILASGYVASAGTLTSSYLLAGGDELNVQGVVSAATVSAGGVEDVFGTDLGAKLFGAPGSAFSDYGRQIVMSTGNTQEVDVFSGGVQETMANGTVTDTLVLSGGLLQLDSGGYANGAVVEAGGELSLAKGAGVANVVLDPGATIDLDRIAATSASLAGGELVVTDDGRYVYTLDGFSDTLRLSVTVASDGEGGTDIMVTSAGVDAARAAVRAHPAALVQAAAGMTAGQSAMVDAKAATSPRGFEAGAFVAAPRAALHPA